MIDLDRDFRLFAAKLLKDAGEVKEEETEAFLNSATERWLARKNPLLDGLTPDEYFGRMEPDELVSWLKECCAKRYSVPEPLYRKISATRECESALCALAAGDAGDDTRATALSLLIEMDSPYADKACVVNAVRGENAADIAIERLKTAGAASVTPLLDIYPEADDRVKAIIIEILVRHPEIKQTLPLLEERLLSDGSRRAFYAACAAASGDAALLKTLGRLAESDDVGYIDYMEISNAIEALGGEPDFGRAFYGDKDYERMIDYTGDD